MLDVGCGDGRWLAEAARLGAGDMRGVDGPWTDLRNLLIPADAVKILDLSASFDLERKFELAISLEVAEHIEEKHAEDFVGNLTRHSDLVLFGAAIPYQGGYRHLNERWPSYWRDLFDARGYQVFDPFRSALWNDPDVHFWYKQNMLLYVNRKRPDLMAATRTYLERAQVAELPIDIVHPEKYDSVASYSQIAFKPLLKQLPGRVAAKVAAIVGRKI